MRKEYKSLQIELFISIPLSKFPFLLANLRQSHNAILFDIINSLLQLCEYLFVGKIVYMIFQNEFLEIFA